MNPYRVARQIIQSFVRRRVLIVLMTLVVFTGPLQAQDTKTDAQKVLKAMSDYIAAQKNFLITFDSDVEVITPEVQKIQFTSSGEALLSRPDKLHAQRTGGYSDLEVVFDGAIFSVYGKHMNAFAQMDFPGSVDQLVKRFKYDTSFSLPGADFLFSDIYDELMSDVIDAKYVGLGIVDGVECDQVAFRTRNKDWQLWVETGDRPIPRKYVITSKAVAAAPQYTIRIKQWQSNPRFAEDEFIFKAPPGAAKLDFTELTNLNEIPISPEEEGTK